MRAIGVSSKRAAFGIASIRDQSIDVEMTNWRGMFTGDGVAAARRGEMVEAVKLATAHESWAKILKQNHWDFSVLVGPKPQQFHRDRSEHRLRDGARVENEGLIPRLRRPQGPGCSRRWSPWATLIWAAPQ